MLVKHPKSKIKKLLIRGVFGVALLEAGAFVVSYYGWYKANTDRETRKYLRDNYPAILEGYYKVGEYLGGSENRTRETDQKIWDAEASLQEYPGLNGNRPTSKSEKFVNTLEVASKTDKPLYRLSKKEIDDLVRK